MSRGKRTNPLLQNARQPRPLSVEDSALGIMGKPLVVGVDPLASQIPQLGPWELEKIEQYHWELSKKLQNASSQVCRQTAPAVTVWLDGTDNRYNQVIQATKYVYGWGYSVENLPLDDRIYFLASVISFGSAKSARDALAHLSGRINKEHRSFFDSPVDLYKLRDLIKLNDLCLPRQLMNIAEKAAKEDEHLSSLAVSPWQAYAALNPKHAQMLIDARHPILVEYRQKLWELVDSNQTYEAYKLASVLAACEYAKHVVPRAFKIKQQMAEIEFPNVYAAKKKP
jgi:hypothetical protein